ncbi:MAG: hypothetical protein QOE41_3665 [Mycobacterium sp.]|nr:hypothetical protein [Mycobacterium sp.]MDT5134354.1 hypothetical protein [Mycobacterium sp.]
MHPNVPGVPWWGALLIAVTSTAIGFAFDAGAGTKELTNVFAALYVIGCVAAVLAVRQAGLFTAVVQPPVLLFISVPGVYFLFHGAEVRGLKDILINCGYPLIERFPLMLFTSAAALLIGLARWYVGLSSRNAVNADPDAPATTPPLLSAFAAKLSGLFSSSDAGEEEDTGKRKHAIDRSATQAKTAKAAKAGAAAKSGRTTRTAKTATRGDSRRSRHARPSLTEITDLIEPVAERPPRSRSTTPRQEPPPEPRRRRTSGGRDGLRTTRDTYERRESSERRAPHDRRGRYDTHDPFEAYEPPQRRRPGSNGSNGSNGTHHPISRVRYRGTSPTDNGRHDATARPGPRPWEPDRWEYDI